MKSYHSASVRAKWERCQEKTHAGKKKREASAPCLAAAALGARLAAGQSQRGELESRLAELGPLHPSLDRKTASARAARDERDGQRLADAGEAALFACEVVEQRGLDAEKILPGGSDDLRSVGEALLEERWNSKLTEMQLLHPRLLPASVRTRAPRVSKYEAFSALPLFTEEGQLVRWVVATVLSAPGFHKQSCASRFERNSGQRTVLLAGPGIQPVEFSDADAAAACFLESPAADRAAPLEPLDIAVVALGPGLRRDAADPKAIIGVTIGAFEKECRFLDQSEAGSRLY